MRKQKKGLLIIAVGFFIASGLLFPQSAVSQENGGDGASDGGPQPVEADEALTEQINFLIELLDRGNPYLTDWARQQLIDLGSPAVDSILASLKTAEPRRRYLLCEILGEIRDRRAVPVLIEHLEDSEANPSVASAAARSLGKLGDRRAIKPLKEVLESSDTELVYHGAQALGNLYATSAREALLGLVHDERATFFETRIANAAIESLGKLRAKEALPEFKKILTSEEKNKEEKGTGLTTKFYVIRALEQISLTTNGTVDMSGSEKKQDGEKTTVQKWIDWINDELGIQKKEDQDEEKEEEQKKDEESESSQKESEQEQPDDSDDSGSSSEDK